MKSNHDNKTMLHITDRKEWRVWLKQHYKSEKEIWLVYYKKHTGKPRIAYNDAVEEALCFGWIDSTVRTVDENRFAQRFSIRNPTSQYSQANRERLVVLAKRGKIVKDVRRTLGDLTEEAEFKVPLDILKELKANKKAWKNFQSLSSSYKRIRIAFIDAARKRPEVFEKRLKYFILMTEKNRRFGFGGIEKYY